MKEIVGLSTALYLFGFLARRAQLHMLGVETQIPLLDQLYLETGGKYFVLTLREGLIVLIFIAVGAVAAKVATRVLRRAPPFGDRARLRLGCVLACAAAIAFEQLHGYAWASGDSIWLDYAHGSACPQLVYRGLVASVLVTALLALWLHRRRAELGEWRGFFTLFIWGALGLELVRLPTDFGILCQTTRYPRVELLDGNGRPLVGAGDVEPFLLLETDKTLVLAAARGSALTVVRSNAATIRITRWENLFSNWRRPR